MTDEMIFWGLAALAVLSFIGAVIFTILDIRDMRKTRREQNKPSTEEKSSEKPEKIQETEEEKECSAAGETPGFEDETLQETPEQTEEEPKTSPEPEEFLKPTGEELSEAPLSGEQTESPQLRSTFSEPKKYDARRIDDLIDRLK